MLNGPLNFLTINEVSPVMYYLLDSGSGNILAYNKYWEYLRIVIVTDFRPIFSIRINDQICVSGFNTINIYDKYLNLTVKSISLGDYSGVYFNVNNSLIYIVKDYLIGIYDQSLSEVDSFTTTHSSWFITEHDWTMLITDSSSGNIYLYLNGVLINTIATICINRVTSILFDANNYMLVLCQIPSYIYIYETNGAYTGISIQVCTSSAYYMNFDSKNRLVITCQDNVVIYY